MPDLTRRHFLRAVAGTPVLSLAGVSGAGGQTNLRMLLNSGYSSVNAAMVESAERARLRVTLAGEMSHPEGARLGIGAIDTARFESGLRQLCESKQLARVPAVADVFDAAFGVPPAERITRLAARV
jgi:hypothetical protein